MLLGLDEENQLHSPYSPYKQTTVPTAVPTTVPTVLAKNQSKRERPTPLFFVKTVGTVVGTAVGILIYL